MRNKCTSKQLWRWDGKKKMLNNVLLMSSLPTAVSLSLSCCVFRSPSVTHLLSLPVCHFFYTLLPHSISLFLCLSPLHHSHLSFSPSIPLPSLPLSSLPTPSLSVSLALSPPLPPYLFQFPLALPLILWHMETKKHISQLTVNHI